LLIYYIKMNFKYILSGQFSTPVRLWSEWWACISDLCLPLFHRLANV
jgi:hypothetical protein